MNRKKEMNGFIETLLCFYSTFLVITYFWMVCDPLSRPFFIDEMVYTGQYLYSLITNKINWFWSVEVKQPLLFWIYKVIYSFLPNRIANAPCTLLLYPRILSAFFIFISAQISVCIVSAKKSFSRRMIIAMLFLTSPFLLVHAQLAVVEPLLVLVFTVSIWRLSVYLRRPSLINLACVVISNLFLILTKTNALIPIFSIFLTATFFLLVGGNKKIYFRNIALVYLIFFISGYLFTKLNPGLSQEASRVLTFSDLSAKSFFRHLACQVSLALYFLPIFSFAVFVLIIYIVLKKKGSNIFFRIIEIDTAFIILILCSISITSLIICSFLKDEFPRYFLFTFLPVLLIVQQATDILLDSAKKVVFGLIPTFILILTLLLDALTIRPILLREGYKSPRIAPADRRQYYDIFAVESFRGIDKSIIGNDAVIFSMVPPHMDGMILRIMLGISESRKRIKLLPRTIDEINQISFDSHFTTLFILIDDWFFSAEEQAKLVGYRKQRVFRSGSPKGISFSLYEKIKE